MVGEKRDCDTEEAPIPEAPLVLLRARCKAPIHRTSVLSPIRKTSEAVDRTHDPWVCSLTSYRSTIRPLSSINKQAPSPFRTLFKSLPMALKLELEDL